MKAISTSVVCLLAAVFPNLATGAVYDEAVNGDLSDNHLAPTLFLLDVGSNLLSASSVTTPFIADAEYFTAVVPAGSELTEIRLTRYVSDDPRAFLGFVAGTSIATGPNSTGAGDLLGYYHFGSNAIPLGTDFLDDMALAFGAQGFTRPLPAGSYTFWAQQTGSQVSDYTFDFVVTAIPEPSALAMILLPGLALFRRRRA